MIDITRHLLYSQTRFEPCRERGTTHHPLPLGGGNSKDLGTGHTRPVNRADGFYGAILQT